MLVSLRSLAASDRCRRRLVLPLALWLVLQLPATAADITVSGSCALVNAINAANSDSSTGGCPAGSGADTVILTGDVTLTAPDSGSQGLPTISTDITIQGNDYTIARSSMSSFNIFNVSGTLTLENTTVSNGGGPGFNYDWGGGIYNYGTLHLVGSVVTGGSAYQGGGIFNAGGTVTLTNSAVSGNSASYRGGGIFQEFGSLTLLNSTVADNTVSPGNGGGIYAKGLGSDGSVTLTNSTISGNTAEQDPYGGFGGGLYAREAPITITNSTLSGNMAENSYAGSALELNFGSTATLKNVTVAGNSGGVAAIYAYDGSVELLNNILTNLPKNCEAEPNNGTIIESGNNIIDDLSCENIRTWFPGIETILADNGGPTKTHALLSDSNAIDFAGDCGLATDQRGVLRSDGDCDSGSFEYVPSGEPEVISDRTITESESHEAEEIQLGPNLTVMGPGGHLTVTGTTSVFFVNEVAVLTDGRLTAGNSPPP